MSSLKVRPNVLMALTLVGAVATGLSAQTQEEDELERLIRDSEREEEELQKISQGEAPDIAADITSARIHMPTGEDARRLRLSQDREIDPEAYIIGPGDVLQLYIFGEWNTNYQLEVNPEGRVLVPTIGEFYVSGKNLAATKTLLLEQAAQKYHDVDISVTLASMRFFTVYITGAVSRKGSYIINPTTRLSDLMEKAGGFRSPNKDAQASRRAIHQMHRDGTQDIVDLEMFLNTGDVGYNPYLRMGDIIWIGYQENEVSIYGAVYDEGIKEFIPGDTAGDMVVLAGGLKQNRLLESVELWRFLPDGATTVKTEIARSLDSTASVNLETFADFSLEPTDMIFVRERSGWQLTPTVIVHGEVTYRGRYRVIPNQTRLRDIIEVAGGLTPDASMVQARLIRSKYRAIKDPEFTRLRDLQNVAGMEFMSPEDRAYIKTKSREDGGLLAIDFARLLAGDEEQNVLLEGGDVIFIPTKLRTVKVSGGVQRPGMVKFDEGRPVSFYLDRSGGYSFNANVGGARLISARTGKKKPLNLKLEVEAGDEIWIPEKEYFDWWEFTQSTMRTIAETVTLIVIVRSI